jgi:two-component system phosphate regulon sensor histidine kinase PhoR
MLRLSRIWKLYLIYTGVLLVTMTVAGFILNTALRKELKGLVKEDVLTLARVIETALPPTENPAVLDAFCEAYQNSAGVRITIIKTTGRVIGESGQSSIHMENHLERPEVQAAIISGTGTSIRYSKTLHLDMMYVALLIKEKDIILRLAEPLKKVKRIENQVMALLSIIVYLSPILAMLISFLFARYIAADENRTHRHTYDRTKSAP